MRGAVQTAQEEEEYRDVNKTEQNSHSEWFAIKTMQDFKAEKALSPKCEDVFFPTVAVKMPNGTNRRRALIPHVLFIKATKEVALELEREGRMASLSSIPFWIFRYPKNPEIQAIPQKSIDLLKLLTIDDCFDCRVYNPTEFVSGDRVKVIGGLYKGYEGFVKRIDRNRRVVVEIEGICMVILPFIHPDLLVRESDNQLFAM